MNFGGMEQRRREIFSKCHCNALDRVEDVNAIEAGHVPLPDYIVEGTSSSTKDRHQACKGGSGADQKRRKGIPWTEEEHRMKTSKYPHFRLLTFPVLVGGPFGVVSAELIGIILFTAYIIWRVFVESIKIWSIVSSRFHNLLSKEKSALMLELAGLSLGLSGLHGVFVSACCKGISSSPAYRYPFEHVSRYHVRL
ncbi:Hypothetical predicted protein [Olea europaea subsp. europaea]|uniref:Uncharacterized protein n=1 Tax=Olea europaea subsp. europaea TaxID=158383 RepID=A0A8S0SI20_OLEEU|nr:Hypothetical predicted protein [Olea europaea subsp. europaea]